MNNDVRIGTDYPHHPKIRKLRNQLGDAGVVSHIFLLCFTARICPSGELKDMDMEDISMAAQWKGNAEEFVNTLARLKLLDSRGNYFAIHNWLRWNLFAASAPKRSEIARANIKKRWEKKNEIIQTHNTDGNTDGNWDRSSPSPSPSPKGEGEGELGEEPFGDALHHSPLIEQILKLAGEMYRGNYIDTGKERRFFSLYTQVNEEERSEVDRLAELSGIQLPQENPYS
jgi:hypothetical protein